MVKRHQTNKVLVKNRQKLNKSKTIKLQLLNQTRIKKMIKKKISYLGSYLSYHRQKNPTPDEEDSARAFYTSLLTQNPKSQMAKKYCLEYGLLDKD